MDNFNYAGWLRDLSFNSMSQVTADRLYQAGDEIERLRKENAELLALVPLLIEIRATFEMWKDVAPAVSLCADIDKAIARVKGAE